MGEKMEKDKIITQLRRIEGQLRGIMTMMETDRGLVPTMQQLMAAQSSLKKVARQYVKLFVQQQEEGRVELTQEQLDYILKLIDG
jgi:DNA-binding FrmR family transcriptional regulator